MKQVKDWTIHKIKKGWAHLRPAPEMKKWQKGWRYGALGALAGMAGFCVLSFLYFIWLLFTFDPTSGIPHDSTLIYDRAGNILYTIHGDENRKTLDSLDEISPQLIDATLAIEDDQFYHHIGIDIPGLIKAVLHKIGIGPARGGSTITQQFVRNGYLSLEKTYSRKYREIMMSLVLELKFSKDDILRMYLNEIPYGNNAYGIELAAERYFGKSAAELTLGESALLAAIPNAPTRYSPYGTYKYSTVNFELTAEALNGRTIEGEEDLESGEFSRGLMGQTFTLPDGKTFYIKGRSDIVLDRMLTLGMITETEKTAALAEIQSIAFTDYKDTISAPHFVMWVKQQLETKYGKEIVEQGGLKVTTTIDPDFQKAAEDAIDAKIKSNLETYNSNNAALVSIQPQTGQILAMVGSAEFTGEYADQIDGQVNVITSERAPGSAFKPFVYALAFLNQYTPGTVLYDVSTSWGSYAPKNFDGKFWGPMTMRYALGKSRNIPAIKAYFLAGQEEKIIAFANKFGFNIPLDETNNYGPSLALGTGEATPLEMAEAYGVFANNGYRIKPTAILKVETLDGTILEQWEEKNVEKTEVLDPQVAYLINDILSDPNVNIGGNMYIPAIDNAAKTGTSTDNETGYANNGWIAAYTPTLVTIGWSGNTKGAPMNAAGEAYYTIAPIWKDYMNRVLNRLEPTVWERPTGITETAISKACGTLPSSATPSDQITTEIFASFALPTKTDDCYRSLKIETITNKLATEFSPEEFVEEKVFRIYKEEWDNWQGFIDKWVAGQEGVEFPPTEYATDIHNATTSANAPEIIITSPSSLSSVSSDERSEEIEVEISSTGNGIKEVVFLMNGLVQYHATSAPYTGSIRVPVNAVDGDILEITAKAIDQYGYSGTSTIQLRVKEKSNEDKEDEETTVEDSSSNESSPTIDRLLPKLLPQKERGLHGALQ